MKNETFSKLFNEFKKDVTLNNIIDKRAYIKRAKAISKNLSQAEKRNFHDVGRALYVYECKSIGAIAKILGIDHVTMSRIKNNSPHAWEIEKEMHRTTKHDSTKILRQSINSILNSIAKSKLTNGNYADKLVKLVKVYDTVRFADSKAAVQEVLEMFNEYLQQSRDVDYTLDIKYFMALRFYIKDN